MDDSVFDDVYTTFGHIYNLEIYKGFCKIIEKDYDHQKYSIDKEFSHYNTLTKTIHKIAYIKILRIKYSRKKKLDKLIAKLKR